MNIAAQTSITVSATARFDEPVRSIANRSTRAAAWDTVTVRADLNPDGTLGALYVRGGGGRYVKADGSVGNATADGSYLHASQFDADLIADLTEALRAEAAKIHRTS